MIELSFYDGVGIEDVIVEAISALCILAHSERNTVLMRRMGAIPMLVRYISNDNEEIQVSFSNMIEHIPSSRSLDLIVN